MILKNGMAGANRVLFCAALFSSCVMYASGKTDYVNSDLSVSGVMQDKIVVSGTVKDVNGEPLIGVNVLEKGTTNGVITDFDGNFSLSVSGSEAVLEFSYIGYNNVTVKVGNQTSLSIEMVDYDK